MDGAAAGEHLVTPPLPEEEKPPPHQECIQKGYVEQSSAALPTSPPAADQGEMTGYDPREPAIYPPQHPEIA
ncbi:MAG: hypothetical protein Fur0034_15740 [Desulfuromonadia bacterium]